MEKTEAETLAKAAADVAKFYPTAIDPKTIAWVNLATCIGLTYGPRVYVIRKRLENERRVPKRPANEPTPEAKDAATFIPPGMPGGIGPVTDATSM